ncbi:hypothetical protein [Streptomyces sp. NPDC002994]|uniref:hypothetical protein n=1 Tax=Streptomyces sp. NPDC002994 TaxID=3154441 RepID=UPI0033A49374
MPPTPPADRGSVRSAAEVNAEMRALWVDGALSDAARYQALLEEWAEAVKASVVEAA